MIEKKRYDSFDKLVFSDFTEIPWPCFTRPKEDELLTSWLTRLARKHLMRYYAFCSSNFLDAEFWNRDLDRNLPETIKNKIIRKCGLTEENIFLMTLNTYNPNLFITAIEPRTYWFTPLLFYENNRKHNQSMAICPSCLKNDGEVPYYRKKWRLTISTVCTRCKIYLIDKCPQCGSSINYLLSERGKKYQAPLFPISCCWKCLFDFRLFTESEADKLSLETQTGLNQYLSNGHAMDRGLNYSHLYFLVLKKIISILNRDNSTQLKLLQETICSQLNIEYCEPLNNRENTFSYLPTGRRRDLINKASWLLNDWPNRFRSLTAQCGLKSKIILDDFRDCPYWFYLEVNNHNKVIHSEWRNSYPNFNYSSYGEFSQWQLSKKKRNKSVGVNIRSVNKSD